VQRRRHGSSFARLLQLAPGFEARIQKTGRKNPNTFDMVQE
jgi:hypothetical protein